MPLSGSGSVIDVDDDAEMVASLGGMDKMATMSINCKNWLGRWRPSAAWRKGVQMGCVGRGQALQDMTRRIESAMAGSAEAQRGLSMVAYTQGRGGGK
eukprot:11487692-Karenia_brevis.AAC.1